MSRSAIAERVTKAAVFQEPKPKLCMASSVTKCGNLAGRRDVCDTCYMTMYNDVKAKVYQWEDAERAGLCAPPKRQMQKRILKTIIANR